VPRVRAHPRRAVDPRQVDPVARPRDVDQVVKAHDGHGLRRLAIGDLGFADVITVEIGDK
jgi:hypothetical protein